MLEKHLSPISLSETYKPYQLGKLIDQYVVRFPSLENKKIALLRVCSSKQAQDTSIRKAFYSLIANIRMGNNVVDLGNIIEKEEPAETNTMIKEVCSALILKKIIPLVITSHPDQAEHIYQALEVMEQDVELAYISSHLPLLEYELLNRICIYEPNFLKNLSTLGFQSHYIPPKAMDILENLSFDHMRLGSIRHSLEEAEIYLRNATLTMLSLDAIRYADAPAQNKIIPNGLSGEEACQLARYAGASDFLHAFALLDYHPDKENTGQTAALVAQIVWYVIDGIQHRTQDFPSAHGDFITYRCDITNDSTPLLFIKSKLTARWWMKIEHPAYPQDESKTLLIPCTYSDYLQAANEETPQRYLKALKKLV